MNVLMFAKVLSVCDTSTVSKSQQDLIVHYMNSMCVCV